MDVAVFVCVQGAVCMFTVHSAALGWQGLSGTTLVPVRVTESEQVRGENWAICLQHSADTQTERALQTFTPLTASVLHLSKLQRSERTQWNSNHKHNPTRTHWAVSEMAKLIKLTGGWPSKCQRQKSKTGPEAVKQNIAQKKSVGDYMTYFVSKEQSGVYVTSSQVIWWTFKHCLWRSCPSLKP